MIGITIKTLIASLMLGTMACCCMSLNQTQTRAATLPDKTMNDRGRVATAKETPQKTNGAGEAASSFKQKRIMNSTGSGSDLLFACLSDPGREGRGLRALHSWQ